MATKSSATNSYLLVESDNSYASVLSPLKSTKRIKYTCFDVSPSFLVFGATSGGLYVFRREPCTFLQLLPNKEGSVTYVSISPDERFIAFASVRGIVCVLQRTESGSGSRCLNRSTEHCNATVTAICWVEHSDQLFLGDSNGRLSVIHVSLFMSKHMFQLPSFLFMQADSSVVSICCLGIDRLLVSSYTRCYLCDTTQQQYRQIGTQPRDGQYGACFMPSDPVTIYCARPGCRLWEVDEGGVIQRTHQLRPLLDHRPPVPVVHHTRGVIASKGEETLSEQPFNFAQLHVVLDKFLFTFKQDGIYILDPANVDVLLWSNCYKDIVDAKCIGDIIYVWCQSQEMHALQITSLDKCLLRLYFYKHYNLCSDVCLRFSSLITQSPETLSKLGPLLGLKEVLKDAMSNELEDILKHIELYVKEREISLRLESGIFLVDNYHARWKLIERSKSLSKSNQRSIKSKNSRSRSLPPNSQNRKVRLESPKKLVHCSRKSSLSTNSLPELSKSSDVKGDTTNVNKLKINEVYNQFFYPYSNLRVPQIPVFPLSSPDIIHDALVELGSSVSGKLVSGTKSLLNKLYKTSGNDNIEPLDIRPENYVEVDHLHQCKENDENIVEGQNHQKNRGRSKVDVSELIYFCNNNDSEITIESLEDLIEKVTNMYTVYKNDLAISKSKYQNYHMFPFSHYLNEDQFLVIANLFHKSFKNGTLLQWLYNQQCTLVGSTESKHPSVLQKVYSLESLQMDLLLSKLVQLFSELLDPYNILQCLESLGLPCVYLTWCVAMDRFQEGTLRYITKNEESDNISCTDWPLPLLLNAIFLSFRLDQVDSCFRMAITRNVRLETISYILLKLTAHLEDTGLSKSQAEYKCNNLLLNYISKVIRKDTEVSFTDIGLVSHIESGFISLNSQSGYKACHCVFPIPGSTITNTKFADIGEKLLSYHWEVYTQKKSMNGVKPDLLSHTSKKINVTTDSFLKRNPIFKELLIGTEEPDCSTTDLECLKHILNICRLNSNLLLWTLNNKARDMNRFKLLLVIQLGLVSELENIQGEDSEEWWQHVVQLNANVKMGKCCACNTQWPANKTAGFQWSWLATTIIKHIGPQRTLSILKEHLKDVRSGQLDKRFYQGCVVTGLIDGYKEGLRKNVSNILPSILDSKTKRTLISTEVRTQLKTSMEQDFCPESTDGLASSANPNWGMNLDLKNGDCALCSLSVGAPRLLCDAGLRVFLCSHAFHKVCLRVAHSLLSCPLCTRRMLN